MTNNSLNVRQPSVAGSFYPYLEKDLRNMISSFLDGANVDSSSKPRAFIVPHAGYIYSGQVAAHVYKLLSFFKNEFSKFIIIGPSHYGSFNGIAESNYEFWSTPLGIIKSEKLSITLTPKYQQLFEVYDAIHQPEHSIEVQIPFIQSIYGDSKNISIYPLLTGNISPKLFAESLFSFLKNNDNEKETLIIISSDLSHYHSYDECVYLDSKTNDSILNLKTESIFEACGKTGIKTLIELAKLKNWKPKLLDYKNSGDVGGPKNSVVGYSSFVFF